MNDRNLESHIIREACEKMSAYNRRTEPSAEQLAERAAEKARDYERYSAAVRAANESLLRSNAGRADPGQAKPGDECIVDSRRDASDAVKLRDRAEHARQTFEDTVRLAIPGLSEADKLVLLAAGMAFAKAAAAAAGVRTGHADG